MPLKAGGAQNQTPGSTRAYAVGEKPLPHIQETRGAHLRILAGDAPASVMQGSDQHGGGPPASGATQITAPCPPHRPCGRTWNHFLVLPSPDFVRLA